jgi:hypothetical protein
MRRSTLKRRRERKRRKHEQLQKMAVQLPPVRKISTAAIIEEIERRRQALAEIFSRTDQI